MHSKQTTSGEEKSLIGLSFSTREETAKPIQYSFIRDLISTHDTRSLGFQLYYELEHRKQLLFTKHTTYTHTHTCCHCRLKGLAVGTQHATE